MRRILLNRTRDKGRSEGGGRLRRIDLDQIEFAVDAQNEHLLAFDEPIETQRRAVDSSGEREEFKKSLRKYVNAQQSKAEPDSL